MSFHDYCKHVRFFYGVIWHVQQKGCEVLYQTSLDLAIYTDLFTLILLEIRESARSKIFNTKKSRDLGIFTLIFI